MESLAVSWYIVKHKSEECKILSEQALQALEKNLADMPDHEKLERWGPFETKNQAIAKRVGLIRAGKCQPN